MRKVVTQIHEWHFPQMSAHVSSCKITQAHKRARLKHRHQQEVEQTKQAEKGGTYFHFPPLFFSFATSRPTYAAMPRLCHVSRDFLVTAVALAPAQICRVQLSPRILPHLARALTVQLVRRSRCMQPRLHGVATVSIAAHGITAHYTGFF